MPDDEVSTALLRRSVEELRQAVDNLRTTVEHYAVLEYRVGELEKDVDEVKSSKATESAARDNRRWMVYLAVIAAVLSLVSNIFTAARP